jgi:Neurotransmitter-gated ion-channel ligand binding domain
MNRWLLVSGIAFLSTTSAVAQIPDRITDRPPSADPTPVKAGLYYLDISEIDGATETFTATAYLLLEWNDPRLRFQSPDENQVKLYKPDDIWTPAVEIINAGKLDDQKQPVCTVTSDGTVYYTRRVVASLNTPMDLQHFPFDRQQLNFIVESSRYGDHDVVFNPDPDQSGLGKDIVPRGWTYAPLSWKVTDRPFAQTQESYSRLVFSFEAKRDASYFIWKIIFPTAIFVLLTWSIFWMQVHDVQTALMVSITVLLTAVAFGNVTDALLPKLGYRTWLDQFQFGSFLFIVGTVIETITVYGIHLGGEVARAEKVRKLLRIIYPVSYALFCLVLFSIAYF